MYQMKIYVGDYFPEYEFNVHGVSYIGEPIDNTVMYVAKKVEYLLKGLHGHKECLVFAENGIVVDDEILHSNAVIFTDNPQREYIRFVDVIYKQKQNDESKRKYIHTEAGYYVGENVKIGMNSYIEPGCVIGHDVVIGDNACIMAGSVIKNATVGDGFVCNEGARIGVNAFTMAEDDEGNKIRIPTLGRVLIGNYVEIGANDTISCGTARSTIIEDHVKIDALVYIAHDVRLSKNTEITAGGVIGGYTELEEGSYMGFNACVRNRIHLGKDCVIGMGATVTKSVENGSTVVGNPAKLFVKNG